MINTLPRNSILTDSGFWLALANRQDRHHQSAVDAFNQYESFLFIVTWPVIIEASHHIQKRVGFNAQIQFLGNIQNGGADIFHLDGPLHWQKLVELMRKYSDLPMDLADASLVILAEEMGHGRILSTDERDFNTYRWKSHKPFENLLLPEL
jgi:predicted nucleic acid-binding protein